MKSLLPISYHQFSVEDTQSMFYIYYVQGRYYSLHKPQLSQVKSFINMLHLANLYL